MVALIKEAFNFSFTMKQEQVPAGLRVFKHELHPVSVFNVIDDLALQVDQLFKLGKLIDFSPLIRIERVYRDYFINDNYLILHYNLMIYNGNNSYLSFKEVDLTGISQIMAVTIAPREGFSTAGVLKSLFALLNIQFIPSIQK